MGDWLRRLLYPLLLPAIVGTVWVCGWVRQQDDRARWIPPGPAIADAISSNPRPLPSFPPAPPRQRRSEFFAAAEAEDAAGGP